MEDRDKTADSSGPRRHRRRYTDDKPGEVPETEQAERNWPTRLRENEHSQRARAASGESFEDQADNALYPPKDGSRDVKTHDSGNLDSVGSGDAGRPRVRPKRRHH